MGEKCFQQSSNFITKPIRADVCQSLCIYNQTDCTNMTCSRRSRKNCLLSKKQKCHRLDFANRYRGKDQDQDTLIKEKVVGAQKKKKYTCFVLTNSVFLGKEHINCENLSENFVVSESGQVAVLDSTMTEFFNIKRGQNQKWTL